MDETTALHLYASGVSSLFGNNSLVEGQGVYTFADGRVYEGQWKAEEVGTLKDKNGTVLCGLLRK
ncbi:hypothetical protein FACS189449_01860 [Alphaproteobacteria bacterium]|nr:hypothetical protein FACS189449_01860 [Alphaproteobacteria bacterium]